MVGLDEDGHDTDTETDMNFDRGASLEQFYDGKLLEGRDVDRSTDVSQDCSLWMVLAKGNGRVVVARPRNKLAHPSEGGEGRERREED